MSDYPKPEKFTSATVRGTVCYRDLVTIRRDISPGGSGQPEYNEIVATNLPCEILQVAGGEVVRGRQVEARTSFVVSCPTIDGLTSLVDARCEIEILTGPYTGQTIYLGRVHHEQARSRPLALQLHCGTSNQWGA